MVDRFSWGCRSTNHLLGGFPLKLRAMWELEWVELGLSRGVELLVSWGVVVELGLSWSVQMGGSSRSPKWRSPLDVPRI